MIWTHGSVVRLFLDEGPDTLDCAKHGEVHANYVVFAPKGQWRGYRVTCRECANETANGWRARNRNTVLRRERRDRRLNPAKHAARNKRYYDRHQTEYLRKQRERFAAKAQADPAFLARSLERLAQWEREHGRRIAPTSSGGQDAAHEKRHEDSQGHAEAVWKEKGRAGVLRQPQRGQDQGRRSHQEIEVR